MRVRPSVESRHKSKKIFAGDFSPPSRGEEVPDSFAHELVALARRGLHPGAVEYDYLAAPVADEPALLQSLRDRRHARARHAEHVGEELLREINRVGLHAVAADEKPAAESLLHVVELVARGRLRYLREQRVREAQQHRLQAPAAVELRAQRLAPDAQRVAWELDNHLIRGHAGLQHDGYAGHAFVADHPDLDGSAALRCGEQREHAALREVCVAYRVADVVDGLAGREPD